jgi:predicted MFS family arabinose efflux permease
MTAIEPETSLPRTVLDYLRSLNPRLPRAVWTMEAGGLANAFGNGLAFPFLFIYLHNVRGFALDTVGLIVASSALAGIATIPVSGAIVDRLGGRRVLAASLVLLAVGFGLLPLVREPWHALVLMAVGGVGNGAFWPSQSTLLAGLAPVERRHAAYGLQRVTRNLGIGLGGLTGGLIATTESSTSYTVLFALDALTFLVFVVVLTFVPDPPVPERDDGIGGRYLDVVRDRVFLGVVGLNAVWVAAGYAVFELLPVYAKNEAGVGEKAIGVIFFVNTVAIVLAQLPLVKLLEGRRRMRALAFMTLVWASAWLVVLAGGLWFEGAAAALVFGLGAVVFGIGECFHGPTQGALVADLASDRVRGRYMAFSTLSWEIGFAVGPAIGGVVLDRTPNALWLIAAAACLVAGLGATLLERRVPVALRLTPA